MKQIITALESYRGWLSLLTSMAAIIAVLCMCALFLVYISETFVNTRFVDTVMIGSLVLMGVLGALAGIAQGNPVTPVLMLAVIIMSGAQVKHIHLITAPDGWYSRPSVTKSETGHSKKLSSDVTLTMGRINQEVLYYLVTPAELAPDDRVRLTSKLMDEWAAGGQPVPMSSSAPTYEFMAVDPLCASEGEVKTMFTALSAHDLDLSRDMSRLIATTVRAAPKMDDKARCAVAKTNAAGSTADS